MRLDWTRVGFGAAAITTVAIFVACGGAKSGKQDTAENQGADTREVERAKRSMKYIRTANEILDDGIRETPAGSSGEVHIRENRRMASRLRSIPQDGVDPDVVAHWLKAAVMFDRFADDLELAKREADPSKSLVEAKERRKLSEAEWTRDNLKLMQKYER